MDQLKQIILEIHRRSLWQVLGIYIVSAWVIWQVIGSMYEWMGLPDWVPPTALIMLLVGLPVVLATAFVQEGLPGLAPGSEREAGVGESEPAETSGAEAASGRGERPTGRPFLTWNRVVVVAVLAFAGLGVAASGFMGMRALGIGPAATLISSGELEARDPIVLADFAGTAGDSTLGEIVTEALRIDLAESPIVRLVPARQIRDALERMRRDPTARLDESTAREVALREGLKAVLTGEVREAAGSYILTARLVTPDSGRDLAAFRQTAADSAALIPAIDALSEEIREEVGEPLASVRSAEPLERVTTPSLTALRLYSQGMYEEAIAVDSTFAMAWRKLAVRLSNNALSRTRQLEAATRAYELRDRLGPRERGLAEFEYHTDVTGDWDRAEQVLRTVAAAFPDDPTAHNNLRFIYLVRGDYERAMEEGRKALETGPTALYLRAIVLLERRMGHPERALALLDSVEATFPDSTSPALQRASLLAALGRYEESDSVAARVRQYGGELIPANMRSLLRRSSNDAVRGRLREALNHLDELGALVRASPYAELLKAEWIEGASTRASWLAGLLGDTARAALVLEQALAEIPIDSLPPLDRPYGDLAYGFAYAGDLERALRYAAAYDSVSPGHWSHGDGQFSPALVARGIVALRQSRPDEALLHFRRMNEGLIGCQDDCALPLMARAHELAGRPDSAIAIYERYLRNLEEKGQGHSPLYLTTTLQRLPVLYEARGDRDKAARLYARFIDLWQDADPELQPRVEAARRALERLTAEG